MAITREALERIDLLGDSQVVGERAQVVKITEDRSRRLAALEEAAFGTLR